MFCLGSYHFQPAAEIQARKYMKNVIIGKHSNIHSDNDSCKAQCLLPTFISTGFNHFIEDAIDSLKSGVSFEVSSLSFSEQLRLVNSSYNDRNQDNLSELLAPEMIFLTELLLAPEAMTALSAKSSSKAEIMQIEEDSPGDEGAIFASLLKRESLSTAELLDLKTENDHATLHAEGQRVLANLDLLAETSGEINQPFIFQVPDSISPDTFGATDAIDLDFQTSVDNAKISEIVVRSTNKKLSKNSSIPSRRVSSDWESELIQILNYDMKGPHEGKPSGVPSSYDWANGPIVDKSRDVSKYEAYTAWGQVYSDAAGNPATNTRVQIKDVQTYMLSKQDGKWHLLQSSIDVDGAAYREDFSGDVNIPADIREEPDGSISVQLSEGYNYHFWPSTGRTPINPEDVAGLVMTVKARLITDNPQQPDDRSEARYLLGMGGDYWTTMTAQWDNWTTNGGVGVGKLKYVTPEWQYFTMHTLSPEEIRQNPPPLEKFQ